MRELRYRANIDRGIANRGDRNLSTYEHRRIESIKVLSKGLGIPDPYPEWDLTPADFVCREAFGIPEGFDLTPFAARLEAAAEVVECLEEEHVGEDVPAFIPETGWSPYNLVVLFGPVYAAHLLYILALLHDLQRVNLVIRLFLTGAHIGLIVCLCIMYMQLRCHVPPVVRPSRLLGGSLLPPANHPFAVPQRAFLPRAGRRLPSPWGVPPPRL
jgi:hypothetical protein